MGGAGLAFTIENSGGRSQARLFHLVYLLSLASGLMAVPASLLPSVQLFTSAPLFIPALVPLHMPRCLWAPLQGSISPSGMLFSLHPRG